MRMRLMVLSCGRRASCPASCPYVCVQVLNGAGREVKLKTGKIEKKKKKLNFYHVGFSAMMR